MTKTHQEKLQAVTKAIQEAVPSLMEPTFGCKVAIHDWSVVLPVVETGTEHGKGRKFIKVQGVGDFKLYLIPKGCEETFTVVGHPITIAEVLRKMELSNTGDWSIRTDGRIKCGNMSHFVMDEDVEHKFIDWNLTLPLDQQESEVIDFLFSLIQS